MALGELPLQSPCQRLRGGTNICPASDTLTSRKLFLLQLERGSQDLDDGSYMQLGLNEGKFECPRTII